MTNRWTGLVLVACLGTAVPASAQYLPTSGTAAPTPEPMPFAPSYPAAQPPLPAPPGCESPLSLPSDAHNAFMKEPKNDEFNNLYFGFEYLLWFLKGTNLDGPLVTTAAGTPDTLDNFGALRQPNTAFLFGANNKLNLPGLNGARFTFGAAPSWFLPIEFSIFGISGSKFFEVQSDAGGNQLFARPVFGTNLNTNNIPGSLSILPTVKQQETVYLASFPGLARGGIKITAPSRLWGLDLNLFADPLIGEVDAGGMSLDLTFGYKYLNLQEQLNITNSLQSLDPAFSVNFVGEQFGPGNITMVKDNFISQNYFNGGQIGLRGSYPIGPFVLGWKTNVAVGQTYQVIRINGNSTIFRPEEAPYTVPGGILAVASNSGRFTSQDISVVPELAANLELPVFNWLRLSLGFNFLYWSNVVRPAEQLSRQVDTRQIPTDVDYSPNINSSTLQPSFQFRRTDFWATGLTAGFAITY